jgi:hypothetical protein
MAMGVDRSPAGAVDVHAVSRAMARINRRIDHRHRFFYTRRVLGIEDRDANSLSLDLQTGDATI